MMVHPFLSSSRAIFVLLTVFLISLNLMGILTSSHQSPHYNTVDSAHLNLLRALSHLCQARLMYMHILITSTNQ